MHSWAINWSDSSKFISQRRGWVYFGDLCPICNYLFRVHTLFYGKDKPSLIPRLLRKEPGNEAKDNHECTIFPPVSYCLVFMETRIVYSIRELFLKCFWERVNKATCCLILITWPTPLLSTTLLCTQLTKQTHSLRNGTRWSECVVGLVFESSVPTCACFHSENFFVTYSYHLTGWRMGKHGRPRS